MKKGRVSLSVGETVLAVLTELSPRVGVLPNTISGEIRSSASAYVEDLVLDGEREWRAALDLLREGGITPLELDYAIRALELRVRVRREPPVGDVLEPVLEDLYRAMDTPRVGPPEPGVSVARLTQKLIDRPALAPALIMAAREWWRGSPRFRAALAS